MIKYHTDVFQGSEEWLSMRRGLLTASEMKHIITPAKLQFANNDKCCAHMYELLAQRISKYVEPQFVSDDMMRGKEDEAYARMHYENNYAPVTQVGFITNDRFGFTIGYSPDGLVGDDGIIEIKGRRQKFQVQTIIENTVPSEFMIQIQTGLMVSERKFCDFISYHGGLPMSPIRVPADPEMQTAIELAATKFEEGLQAKLKEYHTRLKAPGVKFVPTERRIEQEIRVS